MARVGRAKKETDQKAKPVPKIPKGGPKKRKAPAKPFIKFSIANREEGVERLKGRVTNVGYARKTTKRGDLSKMLGQMWHELSVSEKKPYEDQYNREYAQYLAQIEEDSKNSE